jgi:hypothetical protein
MDLEERIELIGGLVEEIETPVRERLADIAKEHDLTVSINVATSIGTSLLALALVTLSDETQEVVLALMVKATKEKLKEGNAAMQTEYVIRHAKGEF